MPSRLLLFAFVALLIISACGDSETTPTGVVFGSDELPETLPESFPVPESAVVSTTLIDWDRGRTEVIFRVPADSASTVLYYDQNLPPAGYEITNRTEGHLL